ncbi:MAG: DUF2141 domain-containing protein [Pseudomonadota bacterium]
MKLFNGIVVTGVLMLGLAFLASRIPVLAASETEGAEDQEAIPQIQEGLRVEIKGVRNNKGVIVIAVFDQAPPFEQYKYEESIGYQEVAAEKGSVLVTFPRLIDGPYAVSLFHDENQDSDFNMDGSYPTEGYGTSNAKDSMHEPTFDEAASSSSHISIKMHYF